MELAGALGSAKDAGVAPAETKGHLGQHALDHSRVGADAELVGHGGECGRRYGRLRRLLAGDEVVGSTA